MKCDEYGFINERCFNLRHYMHSMTVASLEMSDEPKDMLLGNVNW